MSFLPQPSNCCDINCSATAGTTSTETAVQVIVGSYDDPNGNVTPDNTALAAIYYQEGVAVNEWRWSVADQMWYGTITP